MKVINRSAGVVCYQLPELRVERVFEAGETKDIPENELESLSQSHGGSQLLKHFLLVDDRKWVKEHWDAPIEYFWTFDDVKNCVANDPVDLFEETLEYAPDGVIDLIKEYAWRLPLTDLNKIQALYEATGFNAQIAAKLMENNSAQTETNNKAGKTRLRREEL